MKWLYRIVCAILVVVMLVSAWKIWSIMSEYKEGEDAYHDIEQFITIPSPTPAPSDAGAEPSVQPTQDPLTQFPVVDFASLQQMNSDVVGWIYIPGTHVNYPIVQGSDNSYYLNHTWKKWTNVVGSIFLECQNSPDLTDFNTIVYGHRMNNGSMFASLKYYKQQSYWAQHPKVYITDDNGVHCYEIFAAYEISTAGDTYRLGFSTDQDKQDFIDYCLEKSVIDTGLTPTVYDRILTLSTCTGNGHATRWVVQALLRGEVPPAEPEQTEEPEPIAPENGTGETDSGEAQPSAGAESVPGEQTGGEAPAGTEDAAQAGEPASEAGAGETDPAPE